MLDIARFGAHSWQVGHQKLRGRHSPIWAMWLGGMTSSGQLQPLQRDFQHCVVVPYQSCVLVHGRDTTLGSGKLGVTDHTTRSWPKRLYHQTTNITANNNV